MISNNEALRQCKFPFPLPTSKPIAALAALKKDFIQCTLETADGVYGYLCSTIQGMWNHYYREHLWKSKNKGGYRKKCNNTNVPWRTGVHCRQFFKSGPKLGYFKVSVEAEAGASSSSQAGIGSSIEEGRREGALLY